ncbi:MAG: hypothetical protein M0R38_12020 [Bacteroidia bacterium]|nr:hypothetical protein [Bacteroidia bacterium]
MRDLVIFRVDDSIRRYADRTGRLYILMTEKHTEEKIKDYYEIEPSEKMFYETRYTFVGYERNKTFEVKGTSYTGDWLVLDYCAPYLD